MMKEVSAPPLHQSLGIEKHLTGTVKQVVAATQYIQTGNVKEGSGKTAACSDVLPFPLMANANRE